jgi:hypothetical protein
MSTSKKGNKNVTSTVHMNMNILTFMSLIRVRNRNNKGTVRHQSLTWPSPICIHISRRKEIGIQLFVYQAYIPLNFNTEIYSGYCHARFSSSSFFFILISEWKKTNLMFLLMFFFQNIRQTKCTTTTTNNNVSFLFNTKENVCMISLHVRAWSASISLSFYIRRYGLVLLYVSQLSWTYIYV